MWRRYTLSVAGSRLPSRHCSASTQTRRTPPSITAPSPQLWVARKDSAFDMRAHGGFFGRSTTVGANAEPPRTPPSVVPQAARDRYRKPGHQITRGPALTGRRNGQRTRAGIVGRAAPQAPWATPGCGQKRSPIISVDTTVSPAVGGKRGRSSSKLHLRRPLRRGRQ